MKNDIKKSLEKESIYRLNDCGIKSIFGQICCHLSKVINYNNRRREQKTFVANTHNLYKHASDINRSIVVSDNFCFRTKQRY